MKKKDWYENWFCSSFYKILYKDRDVDEAEDFVAKLVNHIEPQKGTRMLDIACGEGRYARMLAERGFDVTGIDLSQASITSAKKHEQGNLHFYVHDMRFPFYINYFDYAFNFFTSFGYFAKERDHLMAAKSFATALKKGGVLVIDYMNIQHVLKHLVAEETIEKGGMAFNIKRSLVNKHIVKDIRFKDKEGNDHHFAERVAAFEAADFIRLFEQAGMQLKATFGDYELAEFKEDSSPRLIMIFKK